MYMSATCSLFCTFVYFATVVFGNTANFPSQVLTVCDGKTIDNKTIIAEKEVQTSLQCGRACANDKACNSAIYIANERLCRLLEYGYRFLGEKCGCLVEDVRSVFIFKDYPCYFQQPHVNGQCQCEDGYDGTYCENPPRDCRDASAGSYRRIYIHPDICHPTNVSCGTDRLRILRSDDIGWMKLRNSRWDTYKDFGIYNQGIELLYKVTNTIYKYNLLIRAQDLAGKSFRSLYYNFRLGNEDSNYTVYFSHYKPIKGSPDQVLFTDTQFRTFDHNSNACVERHESAFWFDTNCTYPSIFENIAPIKGVLKDIVKLRLVLLRQ